MYLIIITTSVDQCLSLYYVLVLFVVHYIVMWVAGFLAMDLVVGLVVKVCGGAKCVDIEILGVYILRRILVLNFSLLFHV